MRRSDFETDASRKTDRANENPHIMFFIFAWVGPNQNDDAFEANVPLLFLGRRLRRQKSSQTFNLIFLDGYERLSADFLFNLKASGFNVINYSAECRRLMEIFPKLERFGRYEMLCFLRWPALVSYLKTENVREQVFHIDGDVIFNAQPKEIVDDVRGLTFVLQGCPGFVSITNYDWFEYYLEELRNFHRDIEGYSSAAWNQRVGWEQSHNEKWAGFRNRPVISSDQDLISHLIHSGRIIQDSPLDFVQRLRLFYMENPLYF